MDGLHRLLKNHWVAGAGFMAGAMLALVPILSLDWPMGLLLIFLHSPGYMIHQLEEHIHDRFRSSVNRTVFGGREGLTTGNVIFINVGYVWGINLAALFAARFLGEGWGLAAPYLMLVNAAGHIGQAVVQRRYNPGLATSLLIFVPLGMVTLLRVPGTMMQEWVGLGVAIAIHVSVVVSVLAHLREL